MSFAISLLKSKTIWGVAVMVLSNFIGEFTPEEQTVLTTSLTNAGMAFGAVLAVVGRVKAKGPIQ